MAIYYPLDLLMVLHRVHECGCLVVLEIPSKIVLRCLAIEVEAGLAVLAQQFIGKTVLVQVWDSQVDVSQLHHLIAA